MIVFVLLAWLLAVTASPAKKSRKPVEEQVLHLIGVPGVAARLDTSTKEVWRLIARGELFSVKLGRRRLVPSYEVDRYIRALVAEAEEAQPA